MNNILKIRSPAKLIITGEHSILYGEPALAIAVNKYIFVNLSIYKKLGIKFKVIEPKYENFFKINYLNNIKYKLRKNYSNFLKKKCSILDVIRDPFELLQYSVIEFISNFKVNLKVGIKIKIFSKIPIGCGMGSSSSIIICTLMALNRFFDLHVSYKKIFDLALKIENLQHGYSSGLDLHLIKNGGCFKYHKGILKNFKFNLSNISIINTGVPESTTGECVNKIFDIFKNTNIQVNFKNIANEIEKSIIREDFDRLKIEIKKNHNLLKIIGVVPKRINNLINEIELYGNAAKICGAGSVKGNKSGIVIVFGNNKLEKIANSYNLQVEKLKIDNLGTVIV